MSEKKKVSLNLLIREFSAETFVKPSLRWTWIIASLEIGLLLLSTTLLFFSEDYFFYLLRNPLNDNLYQSIFSNPAYFSSFSRLASFLFLDLFFCCFLPVFLEELFFRFLLARFLNFREDWCSISAFFYSFSINLICLFISPSFDFFLTNLRMQFMLNYFYGLYLAYSYEKSRKVSDPLIINFLLRFISSIINFALVIAIKIRYKI